MSSGIDIKAIFDFSHCGSKHHTNDHAYKSALCLNCQMLKGTPRFVRRGTWLKSELCVQPIQFEKAKHANNSLSFAKVLFEHNGFSAHNLNLPEVFLIL